MKRIVGGLGVVIEKEIEVPEKKYTSYEAMILRKK